MPDDLERCYTAGLRILNYRFNSEAELRAFCRGQIAPYKVPSTVEFRTELPKTMVGKVLRRALRGD